MEGLRKVKTPSTRRVIIKWEVAKASDTVAIKVRGHFGSVCYFCCSREASPCPETTSASFLSCCGAAGPEGWWRWRAPDAVTVTESQGLEHGLGPHGSAELARGESRLQTPFLQDFAAWKANPLPRLIGPQSKTPVAAAGAPCGAGPARPGPLWGWWRAPHPHPGLPAAPGWHKDRHRGSLPGQGKPQESKSTSLLDEL